MRRRTRACLPGARKRLGQSGQSHVWPIYSRQEGRGEGERVREREGKREGEGVASSGSLETLEGRKALFTINKTYIEVKISQKSRGLFASPK
ncbi:hypothetical protein E2C01_069495 [Portunus trituberculatus]|uniref:Uncharacterized protein n=1 Tax=Portunus trituberculatus TaxID=210409 RepID=A0A5B7HRP1_PORTR|nr:hypothetical protein [Portunus trituberculatus]